MVSLTASGVFLAGGITAHVVREYHATRYNDESFCRPGVDCSRYRDVVNTAGPLAVAGYAAAGGTLVLGIVLLATSARDSPDDSSALQPWLGRASLGLDWHCAF